MDDEQEFTPKHLEILPFKTVHDIVQYGITLQSDLDDQDQSGLDVDSFKNKKKYNVKNRKFKKESVRSMNRVASLFVLYITTVAESIAKSNKRSTVFDRDIIEALKHCMFWEVESQLSEQLNQQHKDKLENNGIDLDDKTEDEIDDKDTEIEDLNDLETDKTQESEQVQESEDGNRDDLVDVV